MRIPIPIPTSSLLLVALASLGPSVGCRSVGGPLEAGTGDEGDPTTDSSPTTGGADPTGADTTGAGAADTGERGADDAQTAGDTGDSRSDETADSGEAGSSDGRATGGAADEPNVLHVSAVGVDANPGTRNEPMRTIQWAVAAAAADPMIDTIRVATGTYGIDVANAGSIVMVDGVSLWGGYSLDFLKRDPVGLPTALVDDSPQTPDSTSSEPAHLIEVPAGVTTTTVLDGFRLEIGLGVFRTAVAIEGDATIRGNVVVSGNTVHATSVFALDIAGGAPVIAGNRFDLAQDLDATFLYGVRALVSDALIANNLMVLGGASAQDVGVQLTGGAVQFVGNSVFADASVSAEFLRLLGASPTAARIDNNLLEGEGTGRCIDFLGAGVHPSSIRNNVLNCNYVAWGNGDTAVGTWQTVAEMQAGLQNASGNVKLAQVLVDPDTALLLDNGAPCTVARGGLDISVEFSEDIAGLARTDPLSIGAHEWDGACL